MPSRLSHQLGIDLEACWQKAKEQATGKAQLMYPPELQGARDTFIIMETNRLYHQMIGKPRNG